MAVGCLVPIVLVLFGAAGGGTLGGRHDAMLGAIAGAVIGLIIAAGLGWGWARIKSQQL